MSQKGLPFYYDLNNGRMCVRNTRQGAKVRRAVKRAAGRIGRRTGKLALDDYARETDRVARDERAEAEELEILLESMGCYAPLVRS